MTNKEAKEILSRPFNMKNVPQDILEAHRIAIQALEQDQTTKNDLSSGLEKNSKKLEKAIKVLCKALCVSADWLLGVKKDGNVD